MMHGPKATGTWTAIGEPCDYRHLVVGSRYRVLAPFTDYDGDVHPVGETWRFLAYNFLPSDDGLSLIVSLDEAQEWHIRLQDRPEEQGAVLRHLGKPISLIEAAPRPVWRARQSSWRWWKRWL